MHKNLKGFTLIEVLVALLILSIGLLGLAGLQVSGLRSNHSAYVRSQAVMLAQDMADRMRSNQVAAVVDCYEIPNQGCPAGNVGLVLAATDRTNWLALLSQELPWGTGSVDCVDSPCADNSIHTITVQWDDNRTGGVDTTFQLSVRL